ncbi:MjaI family restriction endonuclease [bacterium]|nr:MjaI family restriction endonuclease [FCB group bacterium]MBL7191080.1 MjaI family restriction endonuclease [bacterium]
MVKLVLTDREIRDLLDIEQYEFPKYTSQLINLANQNAQGTRPKVVGQMSDLIQEFPGKEFEEWREWYLQKYPEKIDNTVVKIKDMIAKLHSAIMKIDESMIKDWVIDLALIKTFTGLKFHKAVLFKVAEHFHADYSLSEASDESKGIDGYIGGKPISIKPDTYKSKKALLEGLPERIIFYSKSKKGIAIEFDFDI